MIFFILSLKILILQLRWVYLLKMIAKILFCTVYIRQSACSNECTKHQEIDPAISRKSDLKWMRRQNPHINAQSGWVAFVLAAESSLHFKYSSATRSTYNLFFYSHVLLFLPSIHELNCSTRFAKGCIYLSSPLKPRLTNEIIRSLKSFERQNCTLVKDSVQTEALKPK